MKNLNFLISLITNENGYQLEQAKAAEEAARKLGAAAQILYAGNDSINQSQQLLNVIQSSAARPDAIIVAPVGGTGLPHVARAAVGAGVGWVVLNREVDYVSELRLVSRAPVFCVSSNHLEAGRIQGQHLAAFVPKGGSALYIQGPSTTTAARQRTLGMEQAKPSGTKLIYFKGHWTEESAFKAVCSWMKLSTSKRTQIDMVVAQNDDMAMGARRAFQEQADPEIRSKWLRVPFSGCDGLPDRGQAFVRNNLLAATVVIPANTSVAMQIFAECLRSGKQAEELVLTTPVSFPPLEILASAAATRASLPVAQ